MPGVPKEEGNAPYIPFRTFLNLIVKMEDGVPQRLDSSFLASQAGGMHQPIIAAFRFLGLVDTDGRTQPALDGLATSGDERPTAMRRLIEEHYSWAHLDSLNATQAQLNEAFKTNTGLTGSTHRKAVTFFLHAAKYAQIPVSKHYTIPRGAPGGSGAPRRPRAPRRVAATSATEHGQAGHQGRKPNYGDLHPLISSFIDTLIDKLHASGEAFDVVAFDDWVEAFKKAAPLVPPVNKQK